MVELSMSIVSPLRQHSRVLKVFRAALLLCSLLLSACAGLENSENVATSQSVSEPRLETTQEQPLGQTNAAQTLIESTPLTESLLYDLLIANLALHAQEYELASSSMARAADESKEAVLIERATRYALHAKQYSQAVQQGTKWVEEDSENYLAYLITSVAAVSDGQLELAINLLSQLIELEPVDYAGAYQRIGEIYIQHRAGLKSFDVVKALVQLHVDIPEAWMLQAAIAQRLKRTDDLIEAIDQVLALDNHNERAALLKLSALQNGELEPLQQFASRFSKANPQAKSFKVAYGRALLGFDQDTLALEEFLSILKTAPDDAQALNLVALVYHSLQDFENSATYFSKHLSVQADEDQSRVYLASALHQLGRFAEANAAVKEIKDDTDRFNSYRQIAVHIEETQGVDAGIGYLKKVEAENENQTIQLISDQGHMLARAGQNENAVEWLTRNLVTYPESAILRYQRALLYVELKDIEKHEQDMRSLLAQEPDNAHYHNTLGYSLLLEEDQLQEAVELINKAHILEPNDPYILDSKGWLEFKLGNARKAILYLNQAFNLDPDPEIAAHLGEVHWSLGDESKARDIWLDAQQKDVENKSLNSTIERFID